MSSPDYDTTTGLRALKGDSLISDIDTGFLSLATDVAARLPSQLISVLGVSQAISSSTHTALTSSPVSIALAHDSMVELWVQAVLTPSTTGDASFWINCTQLGLTSDTLLLKAVANSGSTTWVGNGILGGNGFQITNGVANYGLPFVFGGGASTTLSVAIKASSAAGSATVSAVQLAYRVTPI